MAIGSYRRDRSTVLRVALRCLLACLLAGASPVLAQERHEFDIPAGRLNNAIGKLSGQAGVSVGAGGISLSQYRTRSVEGRLTLREALNRLLRGTGLTYTVVSRNSVRIHAARRGPTRPRRANTTPNPRPRPRRTLPVQMEQAPPTPIIVSATKSTVTQLDFPGSMRVIPLDDQLAEVEAASLTQLLARLPSVAQTNLGPGQNKLFLRGIADSSLVGATQSTVGVYLDEARLNFNGASPDLQLYDTDRIEIVEGPQGTLFGVGAIGGVIKTHTARPDPGDASAKVWLGGGLTRDGDSSGDVAGMANLPLTDSSAVRLVAYAQQHGGYIDDALRGLSNINRTRIYGGRASLQEQALGDWNLLVSLTYQQVSNRDSQYTDGTSGQLSRQSRFAEPSKSEIFVPQLTLSRAWDEFELVSSTSFSTKREDATYNTGAEVGADFPSLYTESLSNELLAHETRLNWYPSQSVEVLLGASAYSARNTVRSRLSTSEVTGPESRYRNRILEASVFGQVTHPLTDTLSATLGARIGYSEMQPASGPLSKPENGSSSDVNLLPMAALTWQTSDNSTLFLAYREGYRSGAFTLDFSSLFGVSVGTPTQSDTPSPPSDVSILIEETIEIESDFISTTEIGWRFGRPGASIWSGEIGFYYSDWDNVQADVFSLETFPETANVGNGTSYGATARLNWASSNGFDLSGEIFFNQSSLDDPYPFFEPAGRQSLPNIAEFGGVFAAGWIGGLTADWDLSVRGYVKYIGESQLGINVFLDSDQGDYLSASLATAFERDDVTISLSIANLFDSRGNTFSYGNPWILGFDDIMTPLRPRSIRLGATVEF